MHYLLSATRALAAATLSIKLYNFVDKALQKSPQHSLAKSYSAQHAGNLHFALRQTITNCKLWVWSSSLLTSPPQEGGGALSLSQPKLVALCLTWSTLVPFPVKRFGLYCHCIVVSFHLKVKTACESKAKDDFPTAPWEARRISMSLNHSQWIFHILHQGNHQNSVNFEYVKSWRHPTKS